MSRLIKPEGKHHEHEDLVLASLFIQFCPSYISNAVTYIALKTFSIKNTTDAFLNSHPAGDAYEYINFLLENGYIKEMEIDIRLFEVKE